MKIGYLIDPMGKAETVEIPKDLDGYYKLLDCDTIDIVSRRIGDKIYDIVCDDEGLFKQNVAVSMVEETGMAMLVGKLLICNHDGNGKESSLTDEDVENIKAHICMRCYVTGSY